MTTNADLIGGYVEMIIERIAFGWKPFLLTFVFKQIGGPPHRVSDVMKKEVERVYATMLTRIVRYPRSPWQVSKLPIRIGSPDFPVPKHDRQDKQFVIPNDGQHVHAVALMPPVSRLRVPLDDHIHDKQARYVRDPLFRIHVAKIEDRPGYVTRYALKSLRTSRSIPDDIIVLPRALSELCG